MQNYNPYSYQPANPYQYNPMMDARQRLAQMEAQYPQYAGQNMVGTQMSLPNQIGIQGKIVNDFSEISVNDVPMSGNAAFFPKADGSELQVRSWTANGTIQTVTYKPILEQNSSDSANPQQIDFNALNEDVRALREDILARLDSLEKSMSAKATTRVKKGADEE